MLTTHLIKVGGALYLCVPRKTARTLGWSEGDLCELRVLLDGGIKVRGLKYGRKNTAKQNRGVTSTPTTTGDETATAGDRVSADRPTEVSDAGDDERK
jgi:hypothetical protein